MIFYFKLLIAIILIAISYVVYLIILKKSRKVYTPTSNQTNNTNTNNNQESVKEYEDLIKKIYSGTKRLYIEQNPFLKDQFNIENNPTLIEKLNIIYNKYLVLNLPKNAEQYLNRLEDYRIELNDTISKAFNVKKLSDEYSFIESTKETYKKEKKALEDYWKVDTTDTLICKTRLLSEKEKLMYKWGYELAKYKYPKEFGIYNLSKKELGKRYERYIGYYFEKDDWKVEYNGIIKGVEDRGVDLYARKKNQLLIIQCKRYGKDTFVRENTIQQLKGVLDTEIRKNPNLEVKAILFTPNNNLDENALEELEHSTIKHIVKQHPLNEDYPLIKCNITHKYGETKKIYHLPAKGMYDRIKIEYKKGEKYATNEQEAEQLGFRKANV